MVEIDGVLVDGQQQTISSKRGGVERICVEKWISGRVEICVGRRVRACRSDGRLARPPERGFAFCHRTRTIPSITNKVVN